MNGGTSTTELAGDLLRGAEQIALFVFGSTDECYKRKIYHWAETSRIPFFKLGSMICCRRSTLLNWISNQEAIPNK